ncbi:hypothetical protein JIG36_02270 [Actinoplanes sp. LDG1-06]|uniref:Uncharacterized protein n=1 Tax=Paractinoplanes ovalisporus TaxID=2810368 RepID=A0ABS2A3F4_9ACTN|nr:DUF5999 family protein [Actinoplanes ovalisporus]MBM2614382.1 hypothetical protein [Actinoplanes ovalisporus]
MCTHSPECPPVDQPGWDTAALLVHHEELGWSMLCNGAIVLDAVVKPEPVPTVTVIEMPTRVRTRTRSRRAAMARRRLPMAA